jgi:hypothetical protein
MFQLQRRLVDGGTELDLDLVSDESSEVPEANEIQISRTKAFFLSGF